jgi:hypothetical protein
VLEIVEVVLQSPQHLLEGVGIAVMQRGIGGYPWAYLVQQLIAWVLGHNLLNIVATLRTVAHKGHVAHEDIP